MNTKQNLKVFVADDEEIVRDSVTRRLGAKNIKVKAFASGQQMIDCIQTLEEDEMPTALLVDFVMPEMSGAELTNLLQEKFPHLPVVVISGLDMQGSIQAYGSGAYANMQKPLDYQELETIINELSRAHRAAMDIAHSLRSITEFDACLVWELDKNEHPNYRITGWSGDIDRTFAGQKSMNEFNYPRVKKMASGEPLFISNVLKSGLYKDKEIAASKGWVSLVSLPLIQQYKLRGWLDCYKKSEFAFKTTEHKKHQLGYLQRYGNLAAEALRAQKLALHSRVIHETNQNLVGMLKEKLIYKTILQKAIETTGADCGWVFKYNRQEECIDLGAAEGVGSDKVDERRSLKAGGVTGKIVKDQNSIYIKDVDKADGQNYQPKMHIKTPGLEEKSILAVPIRRKDRVLGVLTLKSKHVDFFAPEDLQLLNSLASIAAVSMERNKLTQHLQGVSRLVQEGVSGVDKTKGFNALAKYVVDAVNDLIDADVNLWTMSTVENEGDNYLRIKCTSNPELLLAAYQPVPTKLGSSINAQALHDGEVQIVKDLSTYNQNPPFLNTLTLASFHWRSFMAVPLLGTNKEHLGVISLLSKEVNKFTYEDGYLVQHFANHAAIALQEQRHIKILQELANTGEQLTIGQENNIALLKKVAELATEISNADLSVLYPYDSVRKHYYDSDSVAYFGDLKVNEKRPTQKPRDKGLAVFIREHEALIVEDLDDKETKPSIRIGLREPKLYSPESPLFQEAFKLISESDFIKREKIRSFIGVSLRAEEQKKGQKHEKPEVAVLYFDFRAPQRFSREELQVIDIFCHQVANVIHRNHLFNFLKKEEEISAGLYQSSLHILEERTLSPLLDDITAEAVRLLQASGSKIYLTINGNRQDLRLEAMKNLPKGAMKIGQLLPDGLGMAREVVDKKGPILLPDYQKYERRVPEFENIFGAVLEVPLLLEQEAIGVLGVFNHPGKPEFMEKDVAVLEKLAAQAALAIYSVRLFQDQNTLYQTGISMAGKSDTPEETGKQVLKALKLIVPYSKATIQLISDVHSSRKHLAHIGYTTPNNAHEFKRPVESDPLISKVYHSRKTMIISDTAKEELWENENQAIQDVRSWACIPLVYVDKVWGFIFVDHQLAGFYTEKDRIKLELFAFQASSSIYNSSIEQRQLKALSSFVRKTSNLQKIEYKEQVLVEAIKTLSEIFKDHIKFILYVRDELYLDKVRLMKKVRTKVKKLNHKEKEANLVFQLKDVVLLFNENAENPNADLGNKLLGPLTFDENICAVLEIYSPHVLFDRNLKHFFGTLLALCSEVMNKVHRREKKVKAFEVRFNPYIAGPPIKSPQHFYGRTALIQKIIDGIPNNNFILEDERRIGKTSILHQLKFHLEQNKLESFYYHPVYLNIESTRSKEFWGHLGDSIFSILGKSRPADAEQPYTYHLFRTDLDQILEQLLQYTPLRKVMIVFLMDEVDRLKTYLSDDLSKLRKLFQEEDNIRLVMAGVRVQRHLDDITSPWYNQLSFVKVGPMTQQEATDLIIDPVKGKYAYAPTAIEMILQESHGRPMIVQNICFNAINNMLNRLESADLKQLENAMILPIDVQKAISDQKRFSKVR